jgi:hypothetical protein
MTHLLACRKINVWRFANPGNRGKCLKGGVNFISYSFNFRNDFHNEVFKCLVSQLRKKFVFLLHIL